MSTCRAQGRPRRGAAEVGRVKIIENLRRSVRMGAGIDLSRKTLSEQAGVTPALISYYFPQKEDLLLEVSAPIMREYRMQVEIIVASDGDKEEILKEIIAVLVRLYGHDGKILDIYNSVTRHETPELSEVARMTKLLVDFFASRYGCNVENRLEAAVFQGAVWGMCRFAAEAEVEGDDPTDNLSPLVLKVGRVVAASFYTEPIYGMA